MRISQFIVKKNVSIARIIFAFEYLNLNPIRITSKISEEKIQLLPRDPRYEPQSTLSNEALCRNLGGNGRGDATSSAETGKKRVRASLQELLSQTG
jgi:hypothetical protein